MAGLDRAINPKSKQSIGKNVRIGLTDKEVKNYTSIVGEKKKKKREYSYGY